MKHAIVPMTDEIAASPNGGKVSEDQFDAVWKITNNLKIARAVIEALGLEVEE